MSESTAQITKKLVEITQEAEKLRGTIGLLEGQLQKRNEAANELAKAKQEITKLKETITQKDAAIAQKDEELKKIQSQHDVVVSALKSTSETTLQQTRTQLQEQITSVQQQLDAAKKEVASLNGDSAHYQKRIKELQDELDHLKAENDALKKAAAEKPQLQGLTNEVRGVVQKTNELEAEATANKQANEKLAKKIEKLKTQMRVYQEEKIAAGRSGVAPPVGKVTLVFTDVQGSTSQWEALPDAMSMALRQHNHLMRTSMEPFGGYEVKTEGDAFMIAFASPVKAVKWCLETQQQLLTQQWPEKILEHPDSAVLNDPQHGLLFKGLRVRMGVHTGEPDCQQDPVTGRMDYFGQMVNRSARVEGFSHGGQIVISSDVWSAVEAKKDELGDCVVKDLGSHRFKGLTTDTHVYQILPRSLSARNYSKDPNVMLGLPHEMQELHGKATANKESLLQLSKKITEVKQAAKNLVAKLRSASGPEAVTEAMAEVEKIAAEHAVMQHNLVESLGESKDLMKNLYLLEEKYNDQHALEDINVCCSNVIIILKNLTALMRETAYQDDGAPRSRILDIDTLIRLVGSKLKELYVKYDVTKKE